MTGSVKSRITSTELRYGTFAVSAHPAWGRGACRFLRMLGSEPSVCETDGVLQFCSLAASADGSRRETVTTGAHPRRTLAVDVKAGFALCEDDIEARRMTFPPIPGHGSRRGDECGSRKGLAHDRVQFERNSSIPGQATPSFLERRPVVSSETVSP